MKQLFGKARPAVAFERVTLRQTKDGNKIARMRFAMLLEGDAVVGCPPEVRAAVEAVDTRENSIIKVELDKTLNGVNIALFPFPDSKTCSVALRSVNLDNLEVERNETKGRTQPHLLFTVEIAIDDATKLRYWIVDNIFNQLWAEFDQAQMTLTPASDEIDELNRMFGPKPPEENGDQPNA